MTELMRRAGNLDWELERGMGTSEMGGVRLRRKGRSCHTGGKGWAEHEMEDG